MQKAILIWTAVLSLPSVSACERTPVKLLICDAAGKDCNTFARFEDLPDCEMVNKYMSANCDSVSTPGKMVCDTTKPSDFSSSFCSY